jgi:hypothetical protein
MLPALIVCLACVVLLHTAGPSGMMHDVFRAAWTHNRKRPSGTPYLRVIQETYEM